MERRFIYVNEKGKEALEKISAFNPDKTKRDLVSDLLIAEAKKYKGRKPVKKGVALKK